MSKHEKQQTIHKNKNKIIIDEQTGIHYPYTRIPAHHLITFNSLKTIF